MTTSKLTIVTISYMNLSFDNPADALHFYALASRAIQLDSHYGALPGDTVPTEYVRSPGQALSMRTIPSAQACTVYTLAQVQANEAAYSDSPKEPVSPAPLAQASTDPDFNADFLDQ